MSGKLYFDPAAEREANEVGKKFMNSTDVVGDMSRAYGVDFSAVHIHTDGDADSRASQRGVDAFSTGSDVFFARDAFRMNDGASRGLLAHELTHSMQQGLGNGGVQTGAPAGAAQGGLIDWFRKLFGRNNAGGEGSAQPETAQNPEEAVADDVTPAEIAEETAPAEETGEEETPAVESALPGRDPRRDLFSAVQRLRNSPRAGGGRNSEKFDRVSSATDAALEVLSVSFSGEPEQDNAALTRIIATFDELIEACNGYLSRSAWTGKGQRRQEIVHDLRKFAMGDRNGFVVYMAAQNEGERAANAMEVLTESRQRTLTLVDRNERDLKHYGNAASYLAKIESGMLEGTDVSGFFKREETFTKRTDVNAQRLDALEIVQSRTPIPKEKYNAIKASIVEKKSFDGLKQMEGYWKDRELHEYIDAVIAANASINTVNANLHNPLKNGESLSLSKRNVATSRLAEILGLGDLVARSETAKLVDATGGGTRTGNLMQEAGGVEVAGYVVDQMRGQYGEARRRGVESKDVEHSGIDDKITPEFMKSLISLQILDNLAAQEDRHSANYFAEIVDGKLGKVQGIDHDFSFGNSTLVGDGSGSDIGTHGRNILDKNGKLRIPYMDKALADRITALKVEDLRIIMADVLEPWAIDALCTRFQQVKDAIIEDRDKNLNADRYLENDADWGDERVMNTLRNAHETLSSGGQNPTNYVSSILMAAKLSNQQYGGSQDVRGWLEADFKTELAERLFKEIQKMDVDDAKACLKSYGIRDKTIAYLEASGQLLAGPATLKTLPTYEKTEMGRELIKRLKQQKTLS